MFQKLHNFFGTVCVIGEIQTFDMRIVEIVYFRVEDINDNFYAVTNIFKSNMCIIGVVLCKSVPSTFGMTGTPRNC